MAGFINNLKKNKTKKPHTAVQPNASKLPSDNAQFNNYLNYNDYGKTIKKAFNNLNAYLPDKSLIKLLDSKSKNIYSNIQKKGGYKGKGL